MQPPETVTLAGTAAGLAAVFLETPARRHRAGPVCLEAPTAALAVAPSAPRLNTMTAAARTRARRSARLGLGRVRAAEPGPPPYFARRASGFGHTPFQASTARAAAAEPLAELESARGAGAAALFKVQRPARSRATRPPTTRGCAKRSWVTVTTETE